MMQPPLPTYLWEALQKTDDDVLQSHGRERGAERVPARPLQAIQKDLQDNEQELRRNAQKDKEDILQRQRLAAELHFAMKAAESSKATEDRVESGQQRCGEIEFTPKPPLAAAVGVDPPPSIPEIKSKALALGDNPGAECIACLAQLGKLIDTGSGQELIGEALDGVLEVQSQTEELKQILATVCKETVVNPLGKTIANLHNDVCKRLLLEGPSNVAKREAYRQTLPQCQAPVEAQRQKSQHFCEKSRVTTVLNEGRIHRTGMFKAASLIASQGQQSAQANIANLAVALSQLIDMEQEKRSKLHRQRDKLSKEYSADLLKLDNLREQVAHLEEKLEHEIKERVVCELKIAECGEVSARLQAFVQDKTALMEEQRQVYLNAAVLFEEIHELLTKHLYPAVELGMANTEYAQHHTQQTTEYGFQVYTDCVAFATFHKAQQDFLAFNLSNTLYDLKNRLDDAEYGDGAPEDKPKIEAEIASLKRRKAQHKAESRAWEEAIGELADSTQRFLWETHLGKPVGEVKMQWEQSNSDKRNQRFVDKLTHRLTEVDKALQPIYKHGQISHYQLLARRLRRDVSPWNKIPITISPNLTLHATKLEELFKKFRAEYHQKLEDHQLHDLLVTQVEFEPPEVPLDIDANVKILLNGGLRLFPTMIE